MKRDEFGWPGHFIASDRCRFHRHTHANGWCVSTVGDYYPHHLDDRAGDGPAQVGCDRLFETMTFPLGPDGEPRYGNDHYSGFGAYNTREDANRGHDDIVNRFAEMQPPPALERRPSRCASQNSEEK